MLVAHGQCIEISGHHEPYLPLLEAVERLARRRDTALPVTDILRRCAPSWLEQMPSLAPA